MKNKKLLIAFIAIAFLILALLAYSSMQKKKPATVEAQPQTEQQEPQEPKADARKVWDEIESELDMFEGRVQHDEPSGQYQEEEVDFSKLSPYPSPSYVSEDEDTLIYRKGIYKRIDFVKEPEPARIDTITIEGIQYVRITD